MAYCAAKAYGAKAGTQDLVRRQFTAVCGGDYDAHLLAADLHGGAVKGFNPSMWSDPIFETPFRNACKDRTRTMAQRAKAFNKLARRLKKHANKPGAGSMRYAATTARAFADRFALIAAALAAYRKRDRAGLKRAAAKIPQVRKSIRAMASAFRAMWLSHNKPEGMEVIQARFGMLDARYQEMATAIQEYLSGKTPTIRPWDWKCPPGKRA